MEKLKILMYSHDGSGVSHTMRTFAIASHVAGKLENCSILLLTDLPIIGRLKFPRHVDYVHLPGIVRTGEQLPITRNLNLELENTLTLRRKITKSAIKTFKPHLICIESDPAVLPRETRQTFGFVRERLPETRVAWGLPDISGEPQAVLQSWDSENIYALLDEIADEIWIHGSREIFDPVQEYHFPPNLAEKTCFTGYIRAPRVTRRRIEEEILDMNLRGPFVLVTGGSGTEGYELIDAYLRFLENAHTALPFQSVIITGPMMSSRDKHLLLQRAEALPGVIFHRYSKHLLQYLKYAEVVVSTGGFNLLCEILSFHKKSIFVPARSPANEHLYRAQIFRELGLVDYILLAELTPEKLGEKILLALKQGTKNGKTPALARIPRNGLDNIVERIHVLTRSGSYEMASWGDGTTQ